jgi:hypothetical protein
MSSNYAIKAISSGLRRLLPFLDPVATPAPVRHAPQPAPHVNALLRGLEQRKSVSMTMAGRTAVLPVVALHRPAAGAVIHPLVQPQPRHSLGSHVWAERNQALGAPWAGSLERHATPQLEARRLALQDAVGAELKAIQANNAVPGARTFGQAGMTGELDRRLKEAERIKDTLDQRKAAPAPPAPLGAEVWNSAQIARVPRATQRLHQMSKATLRQRRDALELALKDHDLSSRMFEKTHGHREFGHEILDQRMAGYRAEIGRIDRLQARRARRR